MLLEAEVDGHRLSDLEVRQFGMLMLLAGYETTSGAMGMSLLHLAQHPEQRAQLFGDADGLAHTAVNELLRVVSPVQVFGRNAAHDVDMYGETIPAGDVVLLAYGAANHDPRAFEHPERCILDRHPNRHVAFGHGRHLCLGANLARLELTIMIERFADLFPEFRVDPERPPTWKPRGDVRALASLHLRRRRTPGEAAASAPSRNVTRGMARVARLPALDRPRREGQSGRQDPSGPRGASRRPAARQTGAPHMAKTAHRPAIPGETGTPAANQSGARINPDAYAEAKDFLPLDGIDHVEFWVGNARQASAYFRALWGFTPVAFAGLETGVRDRASYVLQQHDIRLVLTAPLTPDGEVADHVRAPRRRRPRHRVRGARRRSRLARDDRPGGALGRGAASSSTAARTASCASARC